MMNVWLDTLLMFSWQSLHLLLCPPRLVGAVEYADYSCANGVKVPPPRHECPAYDTKLCLIVRLQFCRFRECVVLLHYHYMTLKQITILYRNTKVKVRSLDGDTEYFDIVAGVQQGDTLAPYLFIICLDYALRTSIDKSKENGFELTKKSSRRYSAKTITDADYADDIAILANTPNQAEILLHSLEQAAAGIGLHVNAHKTEYMCFNQTGDMPILDGTSLKLVDKFTYRGSSVSSTEKDIDTQLTKAWTAIDKLSIIWKSDLTDKMKRSFFQAAVVSILLYGCTTWTLTKRLKKKLNGNYTRMLRAILNKSRRQHPKRHQLYGHFLPSRQLFKLDEPDMQDTAGEAGTSS